MSAGEATASPGSAAGASAGSSTASGTGTGGGSGGAAKGAKTPICIIVIGMAGSGKTTMLQVKRHLFGCSAVLCHDRAIGVACLCSD